MRLNEEMWGTRKMRKNKERERVSLKPGREEPARWHHCCPEALLIGWEMLRGDVSPVFKREREREMLFFPCQCGVSLQYVALLKPNEWSWDVFLVALDAWLQVSLVQSETFAFRRAGTLILYQHRYSDPIHPCI